MKLLYITNGINGSGGLERVLSIKASALADDLGYEVHLLTLNHQNQNTFFKFSDSIVLHDIKVAGHPLPYFKSYILGIKNTIQTIQPDCISVCDDGLKAFFLPRIVGRNIPIIYERHVSKLIEISENQGFINKGLTYLKFFLMDILANDFTKFIVLTNGNHKEWRAKNLEVIPNPLPFFPEDKSLLENKKVIAVGKQSYQKSYDRLLESWSLLDREFQDWELHIYGKIDESLYLKKLAEKLNIENQVFFHHPTLNIEDKYRESSIFVLSSRFEGFGMVIIEAMSFGIPCVSFDCNYGPADIITDEKDGFLIENGNLKEFAEKLQLLMKDKSLRHQFGENGRENVKRFLKQNVVKQWDELFKKII
jgi:glycosyltransferase involved in cell wall biosynthesis